MTLHLGDVPANTTLYIPFASYNSAGASVTLTGLAVTDIEIYKNGSVTQRSSDAGYTLLDTDGIDFDGITGIHGFSVDLSDNTDAGFYAAGAFYWVVVSSVTVEGETINFIAATFRIVAAEATAGVPAVDVTHVSGDSGAADNLETAFDGGSYNVGGGAVVAASVTGNVGGNVTGSVGSLAAQAKADVNVEVDTALADYDGPTNAEMTAAFTEIKGATWATTDTLEAIRDRGDAAWITATGFSTHSASDVWSVGTRLLTAGTNIVLAKCVGVTGFNDLDAAGVRSAVGLSAANLDTQLAAIAGFIDTEIAAIIATLGTPAVTIADDIAALTAPDNAGIAAIQAVTDNLPDSGALTSLAQAADLATLDGKADAIKAKTDSLTFTVAGSVDANIQHVNDLEITGTGVENTDEWRPA